MLKAETLDGDRGLDSAEVALYRTRGWLCVPALFGGAELAGLQVEAGRLAAMPELFSGARGAVPNSSGRTDRLDPVIDLSPTFARAAESPGLRRVAAHVLGGESQLFKDRLIFKAPGAVGYGAHQDAAYWQGFGVGLDAFVTAAICLDAATSDNGPIECTSGENRRLLTEAGVVTDSDESQLSAFTPLLAEPGDVLLIHSLTPHRRCPNRSGETRRILFFVYELGAPGLYERYQSRRQAA